MGGDGGGDSKPFVATNRETGLTSTEVAQRQKMWGMNEVKGEEDPEWAKIIDRYLDWVAIAIVSVGSKARQLLQRSHARRRCSYGPDMQTPHVCS
jgi:hypothetical protein